MQLDKLISDLEDAMPTEHKFSPIECLERAMERGDEIDPEDVRDLITQFEALQRAAVEVAEEAVGVVEDLKDERDALEDEVSKLQDAVTKLDKALAQAEVAS